MKRRSDLFLKDIVDAIQKIKEYTNDIDLEHFKKSPMIIDAAVRNLEIIGEAISQIPEDVKQKYSGVPWQEIKDFRNVVIHKYYRVDIDILWDIIQHKLDGLNDQIEEILGDS